MGEIAALITDAADTRAYECMLPDGVRVGEIAARFAAMIRLPSVGPDGAQIEYGFVEKGDDALDSDTSLLKHPASGRLQLRLVPMFVVGMGEDDSVDDPEFAVPSSGGWDIRIIRETPLLQEQAQTGRPEVRIDARVHREIEEFAALDRNSECIGLLLGEVESENGGRVIHIKACAPAEGAIGSRTSVRMTLPAWESALKTRDKIYGDMIVLGWFHTHAGWGVFMSDTDTFVHRHFFSHPDMVALVIDPTTGRDGFFYRHGTNLSLCPSYGLVGTPSEVRERPRRLPSAKRTRPDVRDLLIALLLASNIYFAFARPSLPVPAKQKPCPPVTKVAPSSKSAAKTQGSIQIYTIGPRDNLWAICKEIYGDGELAPALAEYNHIQGYVGLQVGQKIKLPPKEVLEDIAGR